MRRRTKKPEISEAGVSKAFRSIYEPEHAALERFDDLIAKLSSPAPGGSSSSSSSPAN